MANLNTTPPHDLLSCGICAEPYDNNAHQAKFLSCHHTFCVGCITKLKAARRVRIQCPICRSFTRVPENGIGGLQTNFYITGFQEFSESIEQRRVVTNVEGRHGYNARPCFCVTCGLSISRDCSTADHTAKDGHFVISVTKEESVYLEELNVSHKSLALNKKRLQLIKSEISLLTAAKDSAINDVESVMDQAHQQLEGHRNKLVYDILDRFNDQRNTLLDKQKEIQKATETLNKNITEAETITKTGHLNKLKPINETLKKVNEKTQSTSSGLHLGENYLAFDSNKGLKEFTRCLGELGQTHSKGFLPSVITFGSTEATAGHQARLAVEICNHWGDILPISTDSFSVQVTDPTGTEIQTVLSSSSPECTLTFSPQMSGLHKISGIFLGQQLTSEQTHIPVSSNNPVSKFGQPGNGHGTFQSPWGVAIDNHNCLYVSDVGSKLIQKFTADGEFLSQFSVAIHNANHIACDIALDLNKGLIFCTAHVLSKKRLLKGDLLAFTLQGQLHHTYPLPNTIRNAPFIAMSNLGHIIMSDTQSHCLVELNNDGNFVRSIGKLKQPGHVAIDDEENIIVTDRGDDCVYIFNPDGTLRLKFGSSGTGKGQMKGPLGLATDGENILVSEWGNKRIQVFKKDGTFMLLIDSSEDPLLGPCGLAVTGDGHVYVADAQSNSIKKYKYRDVN